VRNSLLKREWSLTNKIPPSIRRCVKLTHRAVEETMLMMATKPPAGNERLDAHRRGKLVKEACGKRLAARQAKATRNQVP